METGLEEVEILVIEKSVDELGEPLILFAEKLFGNEVVEVEDLVNGLDSVLGEIPLVQRELLLELVFGHIEELGDSEGGHLILVILQLEIAELL